jgi:hypothetical protein
VLEMEGEEQKEHNDEELKRHGMCKEELVKMC